MDISTIFTFTIATALIVAIPGPSILMIVAAGVAGGQRAALVALFAILAVDVILIGLVASGLGGLAELGGATLDWLTAIGGLVLVLLGLRMLRDDRKGVPSRGQRPCTLPRQLYRNDHEPQEPAVLRGIPASVHRRLQPRQAAVSHAHGLVLPGGDAGRLGLCAGLGMADGPRGALGRISALAPGLAGLCLIALGATSLVHIFW